MKARAVATADLLKAKNVPVILSTVLAMPQGEDAFHAATYQAPGILSKVGVVFALSSGGFETSRLIPFQAAMAVAWGLDRDEAIKAITINAANAGGALAPYVFTNPRHPGSAQVLKVDADGGDVLPGATFALHRDDGDGEYGAGDTRVGSCTTEKKMCSSVPKLTFFGSYVIFTASAWPVRPLPTSS